MRRIILGLDHLGAFRELGIGIADRVNDLAGLARCFLQLLLVVGRVVAGMGAVVPANLELITALECGPRVIGNYGDATQRLEVMRWSEWIDGDGLHDTFDFQSR